MKPYKFNKYQEKWLRDLETTKATQCSGRLTNGKGYCCLGRAYVSNGIRAVSGRFDGHQAYLGSKMMAKLCLRNDFGGIKTHKPKDECGQEMCNLANLNDKLHWSFKKIAAFIRKHPRSVFKDQQ